MYPIRQFRQVSLPDIALSNLCKRKACRFDWCRAIGAWLEILQFGWCLACNSAIRLVPGLKFCNSIGARLAILQFGWCLPCNSAIRLVPGLQFCNSRMVPCDLQFGLVPVLRFCISHFNQCGPNTLLIIHRVRVFPSNCKLQAWHQTANSSCIVAW